MNKPFVFVLSYSSITKLHLWVDNEYCGAMFFDNFDDGLRIKHELSKFILEG